MVKPERPITRTVYTHFQRLMGLINGLDDLEAKEVANVLNVDLLRRQFAGSCDDAPVYVAMVKHLEYMARAKGPDGA